MRHAFTFFAASLLLVGAGCAAPPQGVPSGPPSEGAVSAPPTGPSAGAPGAPSGEPPGAAPGPRVFVVRMLPKGGNDEIGNAVFTEIDRNDTRVTITLAGSPKNVVEKAAIYGGTCKDLAAPLQYDLTDVVNGRSSTTLNVNWSSFRGGTPQSVRVYTDVTDPDSTLWSCGDIK